MTRRFILLTLCLLLSAQVSFAQTRTGRVEITGDVKV